MPIIPKILLALAFFLLQAIPVYSTAMSLTFSGLPANINENDPFTINASLINAPTDTTYYLRAAFFKINTTSYFGYTYNHLNQWWNSSGEATNFLEITTSPEGSWSGQLRAKADLDSSHFKGAGDYQFKLGRYTSSGNFGSWSDSIATTIDYTPPPSPEPSPEPEPEATPESDPEPSPEPSPSPSPTPKTTTKTTKTSPKLPSNNARAGTANSEDMLTNPRPDVLGEGNENPEDKSITDKATLSFKEMNPYIIAIILIVLGLGLTVGTGIYFFKTQRKTKSDSQDTLDKV